jgi:hypothetical protein
VKVTRKPEEYDVVFESYREACCFVALYAGVPGGGETYNALKKFVRGYDPTAHDIRTNRAAMRAAAQMVLEQSF